MARLLLLILAVAGLLPVVAQAQNYPSRPITIIVPFAAGGPTDTLARIMAERMAGALGQRLIVENVAGGGATTGVTRVARAAPDGYTLLVGNWTSQVGAPAIYPVQFDILKDFDPVSLLPIARLMIVARNEMPASDLSGLISWLKSNPDKASAGTTGTGSGLHLCGIYLQKQTGARFAFVPYRGAAPALQDLMSGQIDFMCGVEAASALPFVRSARIKAIAVMGETPWSAAPEIPTMAQAGLPGLSIAFWNGLWLPKGAAQDVVAKLDAAVIESLADPATRQRFIDQGQEIPASDLQTPEGLARYHKADIDKWWPVIKAAGIKGE
jgi:tripartite-type tricarboxylate transporter receptor subunit TctC